MSEIVVVGGGFAGVWAALGAARARHLAGVDERDLRLTLIDAGDDMVIRPRLYEADPGAMRVALDRVLGPVGVRRIAATVTGVDTAARRVTAVGRDGTARDIAYDRLVLAAGSRLTPASVDGAEHLFDVDTMPAAARLDAHLGRLADRPDGSEGSDGEGRFTAVVVGAGFTGIEMATELPVRMRAVAGGAAVRVVLVERPDVVGPELGPGPRPEILAALDTAGVEVRVGVGLRSLDADRATLTDGTVIPAHTVVWTAGMRASPLTEQVPGTRDGLGRLQVDEHLRVVGVDGVVDGVFAAGDTAAAVAEDGHVVMQSCQHAVPQGKLAGANVAADVLGSPLVPFAPNPYVTCLDLGAHGAVLTLGWDRQVEQTGSGAKQLKQSINSEWIYPPVDDATEIHRLADHRITWPFETLDA